MGMAKDLWMEEQERGYSAIGGDVCFSCIGPGPVGNCIDQDEVSDGTCTYCSAQTKVFSVEHLTGVLVARISNEWENLYEASLPRDEDTGQPMFNEHECSTEEVFEEEGFSPTSSQLIADLCGAIHTDTWCERNPLDTTESMALRYTWSSFCSAVKTKYRFTFFRAPDSRDEFDRDEYSVAEMLDRLQEVFENIQPWTELQAGTRFFRARTGHGRKEAKDLGTPPPEFAKANRMSPEGIGMFYGAFDEETCLKEICRVDQGRYHECTLGTFQTTRPMVLLDLTKIRAATVFDKMDDRQREYSKFLNHFQRAIAKPVDSEEANYTVGYTPTQILTEFFRYTKMKALGKTVDGIAYNSSTNYGKRCVVLFVDHNECGNPGDSNALLELVDRKDQGVFFRPKHSLLEL